MVPTGTAPLSSTCSQWCSMGHAGIPGGDQQAQSGKVPLLPRKTREQARELGLSLQQPLSSEAAISQLSSGWWHPWSPGRALCHAGCCQPSMLPQQDHIFCSQNRTWLRPWGSHCRCWQHLQGQRLLADLRAQHKTSGLLARQGSSPIAPQYSATGVLLLYQTFPAAFTSAYALPANHRTATAPLPFWQAAVRVSPHNCPCSDGLGQPLFTATTAYKLPPSVTNSTQHPSMTAAPDAVASISKRLHGFRVS